MDSGILSRSKKELKKVRNIKIIELASQFSLDDIAYLYNIESATVSNILKQANKQAKVEKCLDVDRVTRNQKLDKTIRPFLYNSLKDEGFTEADIAYIHERSSSDEQVVKQKLSKALLSIKSESEEATQNNYKDTTTLDLIEEPISDAILARDAIIKANQENLEKALAEINIEKGKNKRLCDELQNKDSRIVALEKGLESERQNNSKVRLSLQNKLSNKDDVIADLKEELLSIKESNKGLSVKYADVELCLNAQNQRANSAEKTNEELQKRIIELESSLNQQIEANLKLQSENEALRKEVEILEADFDKITFSDEEDSSTKSLNKYTSEQKDRMIKVFIECGRNRTKAIELLHGEGIMVSYKHLGRILTKRRIRR